MKDKNHNAFPVSIDLETCNARAFEEELEKFKQWAASQPPLKPFQLKSGWYDDPGVDPVLSADFLRRNNSNRRKRLYLVRDYYRMMAAGDWKKTGQGLVFTEDGRLIEGQHRCVASVFGQVTFPTFIVTGASNEPDLFAYVDAGAGRTNSDALYTGGMDGMSGPLARAAVLQYRYHNGGLGNPKKRNKLRKLNPRQVLEYVRDHRSLEEIGHIVPTNYPGATQLIGNMAVTLVFSDLVTENFGGNVLADFFALLIKAETLPPEHPCSGLHRRLVSDDIANWEIALALTIKAFNLHQAGKVLGRNGLIVGDNESYPQIGTGPAV